MRRLLVLAAVGAIVAAAFLIPAPELAPEPLQGLVLEGPGLSSPEDASIWYCPWAQSDASRDSVFGVVSLAEATAAFTLARGRARPGGRHRLGVGDGAGGGHPGTERGCPAG